MRNSLFGIVMVSCASCSWFRGAPPDIPPKRAVLDVPVTCHSVTIYGASWCTPCDYAERHLKKRGVRNVVKRDVESDEDAARFVRADARGERVSLPVIDVCGHVLHGYSADGLDDAITRTR